MSDVHEAVQAALDWIDYIYPADIFLSDRSDPDAVSDEGVVRIVAIRENLRAALAQRQGMPEGVRAELLRCVVFNRMNHGWTIAGHDAEKWLSAQPAPDSQPQPEAEEAWQEVTFGTIVDGLVRLELQGAHVTAYFDDEPAFVMDLPDRIRFYHCVQPAPQEGK